jgi:hypothetical protein
MAAGSSPVRWAVRTIGLGATGFRFAGVPVVTCDVPVPWVPPEPPHPGRQAAIPSTPRQTAMTRTRKNIAPDDVNAFSRVPEALMGELPAKLSANADGATR